MTRATTNRAKSRTKRHTSSITRKRPAQPARVAKRQSESEHLEWLEEQGLGGLSESDIDLIIVVAATCARHGCFDFVEDVFRMPLLVRGNIVDIVQEIEGVDRIPGQALGERERQLLHGILHAAVREGGGSRALADAFIMDADEWRRAHAVGGRARDRVLERDQFSA